MREGAAANSRQRRCWLRQCLLYTLCTQRQWQAWWGMPSSWLAPAPCWPCCFTWLRLRGAPAAISPCLSCPGPWAKGCPAAEIDLWGGMPADTQRWRACAGTSMGFQARTGA